MARSLQSVGKVSSLYLNARDYFANLSIAAIGVLTSALQIEEESRRRWHQLASVGGFCIVDCHENCLLVLTAERMGAYEKKRILFLEYVFLEKKHLLHLSKPSRL
ncbi:hypothetical protein L1887_15413 [Cichorium endivia]|nr:hypothetical protein L1887_15413 [Cichorium endivia]